MRTKSIQRITFFLLLLIFILIVLLTSLNKIDYYDEFGHLSRSLLYTQTGLLLNVGHPPLTHVLVGTFTNAVLDIQLPENYKELYKTNDLDKFGTETYYSQKYNLQTILFVARLPIILLAVILGIYIYLWARDLYGNNAGLFALFLYTFNPIIIDYSKIILTEMAGATFIVISLYYFWKFLKNKQLKHMILASIFFGCALSSRLTALLIIPMFFFFFAVEFYKDRKKRFWQNTLPKISMLLVLFIISIVVLNVFYHFRGASHSIAYNLANDDVSYLDASRFNAETLSELVPGPAFLKPVAKVFIEKMPMVIPYPFVKDYWNTISHAKGHLSYLNGQIYDHPLWYYYLESFLIRNPLPFLIFLLIALLCLIKSKKKFDEFFLLVPILIFFGYFSFIHSLNYNADYILPVYPFLFILTSKIVTFRFREKMLSTIYFTGIIVLSLWLIVGTLLVFPHYSGYFNELVGIDNGYKYYIAYDRGQDLSGLKEYMDEHKLDSIKLAFNGEVNPEYFGIHYVYLPSAGYLQWQVQKQGIKDECKPVKGHLAVSVRLLQFFEENRGCYDWLKQYEPVEKIGHTLFIYDIK